MNEKQKIKNELEMARNAVKAAGLYLVSKNEIDKLGDVATDAYENYPLHNWFFGGTYNPKGSKILMETSLKSMIDDGVIYADSPEINGFTVWMPPKYTGNKTLPFLLNGGIKLILNSGIKIIARLLNYENHAMPLKKKFTNHNDWYVFNLSVKKSAQGKGIATKLLKPMIEFCNSQNALCYLETNKETNVPMYEHFGFTLSDKNFIPKTNVMHYGMTRYPDKV
jgi:GNAT superfamily N-acetyltransferase